MCPCRWRSQRLLLLLLLTLLLHGGGAVKESEPVTLTPGMVFFIGAAFADWLAEAKGVSSPATLRISMGHDPRLSSPLLAAAIEAGAASRGAAVTHFGLCTTPAMFVSCILPGHDYDGAVMLTASHLPINRNGAKFCTKEGGLEKPDITALLKHAAEVCEAAPVSAPPTSLHPCPWLAGPWQSACPTPHGLLPRPACCSWPRRWGRSPATA